MSSENKKENKMKDVRISHVTLHCSTADAAKLERCMKLLKLITGLTPVKTLARKRIPAFKIRPGMPIGCKVTVRKGKAIELLKILFTGIVDGELSEGQFNPGFLSFGIKEYIEIQSIPYQRDIGIIGFDAVAVLERPGARVSKKKVSKGKVGKSHRISRDETIEFFRKNFEIEIV